MRVLVTGGSGFIGSNLIPSLRAAGHHVRSLDITEPRNPANADVWVRCDVRETADVASQLSDFRPTHVVHLGARTDLQGKTLEDYSANIDGVRSLIHALKRAAVSPRVIYTSSRLVFEIGHTPREDFDYKPSTPYGASKIAGEEIVRAEARNVGEWVIVRPTSIWGPWFSTPYRDFFDLVAKGRYVNPRGHDIMKSFGFVGNAVFQIEKLLQADAAEVNERVFWLTDYPPTRVSEWAAAVADSLGVRRPLDAPMWALRGVAQAGDLLRASRVMSEPPLTSFRLNNLITPMVYDTQSIEAIAGTLPYSMLEGVALTTSWIRENSGLRREPTQDAT
jgi:GlcNAc-P-P-Und epimerase